MKYKVLAAGILLGSLTGFSQITEIDGVSILQEAYATLVSHDGSKIIGETLDGSTVYYDRITGEAYFYENCNFGRGYVVSDAGWVVGCQMIDDQATRAVVMANGESWFPEVFNPNISSNIHSITPDGSRICGVIGNNGAGPTYFPYYCDIDSEGNFGELQFLPTPPKDFFEQAPQYCSATWISEDGSVIAGQVIDARGLFVYPILYTCNESGEWSYSFPSEALFNPNKLPIPKPLGDIEQEFPDAPYPELQNYMTGEEYADFQEAVNIWQTTGMNEEDSPYNFLYIYMSPEKYQEYVDAERKYEEAAILYNEMMENYWLDLYKIADESVFFERNAMRMSGNGKWLASSALVDDLSDPLEPVGYYIPYRFDLETGEVVKIGTDKTNNLISQTFNDGTVIVDTPPDGVIPSCSSIFRPETMTLEPIQDYVKTLNPEYGAWMMEYLTGEVPVGLDPNGGYIYEEVTITGIVTASDDFSVIVGGLDGFALGLDMYLSYIFDNVTADVKSLKTEQPEDGIYRVYNLQGVKVAETKDLDSLNSLAKGLYIINGKKVVLK